MNEISSRYIVMGGRARLTHEFVEAEFAKAGYRLLGRYENNHTKLDYVCPKGHSRSIKWRDWGQGKRCAVCAGMIVEHDSVAQAFQDEGYTLLSKYINCEFLLKFRCPNQHQHQIRWDAFRRGQRCVYCAGAIVTTNDVQKAFQKVGYTLLSEYVRSDGLLEFACDRNHRHRISWGAFKQGQRCAYCAGQIIEHSEVEAAFRLEGYKLLSEYENSKTPMDFECSNGHFHKLSWGGFSQGNRCAYCSKRKVDHSTVEAAFAVENYKLLSTYSNSGTPLRFRCNNVHQHRISWDSFKQGSRCAYCPQPGGGFKISKPGTLYYLRFKKSERLFYKIGITNNSVEIRYRAEPLPFKILMEKPFLMGSLAQEEERRILRKYKKHLYNDTDVLMDGNSELFIKDVLKLDRY